MIPLKEYLLISFYIFVFLFPIKKDFLHKNSMEKKIKVLFRMRSMEMGGVPIVVLGLLNNLPKDKFDFTMLLNIAQGELVNDIPSHVKVISITKGRESFSKNPLIYKIQLIIRRIKLEFYRLFPSVLYALKVKEDFDIEVSPGYAEFEMVLNSPNKKSRKIGWFHSDVSYDKVKKRVLKRIELMKRFDFMVFGSKQTRQVIQDLYGVSYPNSTVIYNEIRIDEVREKAKLDPIHYSTHPVFSSVGRLHPRKGYHTLIKVHARLLRDGFFHSIVIVGGGPAEEELRKQIAEEKVEETFTLVGTQKNPYNYVQAADYFVFPTRSESYPLIIGEVLGLGKPIISTNVAGIPEMIDHNVDGILVNYDEEEIYQAMKQFLTHPELVERIKKGAEQSYKKFDAKKIYQQVTDVFEAQFRIKQQNERN